MNRTNFNNGCFISATIKKITIILIIRKLQSYIHMQETMKKHIIKKIYSKTEQL
jgi:hypothetical protein